MSLILTFLASFATMLGTFPIFIKFKNEEKLVNFSLNFASSIMLAISIFDLIPESYHYLSNVYLLLIFFIIGFILALFIDSVIKVGDNSLYKVGIVSLISLILHNIPEGIITYIVSEYNIKVGLILAISIALHNIPEGISISIPIYYGTGSKRKAITYTMISALCEPLAAILIAQTIKTEVNTLIIGYMLAITAGIMIYVAIFDILKEAKFNLKTFIIGLVSMIMILILL